MSRLSQLLSESADRLSSVEVALASQNNDIRKLESQVSQQKRELDTLRTELATEKLKNHEMKREFIAKSLVDETDENVATENGKELMNPIHDKEQAEQMENNTENTDRVDFGKVYNYGVFYINLISNHNSNLLKS